MWQDPIVEEVRRVRDALAASFNYDLDLIFENIKAEEKASGRKTVRFPPQPVPPVVRKKSCGEETAA
jgi:hypothetical protein